VRLALAQINPVVGDLEGNRELILERLSEARSNSADLVVFPELVVTGYPPEDLLLRPGPQFGRDLYNACYVLSGGEIKAVYRKRFLPNYGVFDEDRYFAPGYDLQLLRFGDVLVGPRSARTSGSRARPRPTSRSPAPS